MSRFCAPTLMNCKRKRSLPTSIRFISIFGWENNGYGRFLADDDLCSDEQFPDIHHQSSDSGPLGNLRSTGNARNTLNGLGRNPTAVPFSLPVEIQARSPGWQASRSAALTCKRSISARFAQAAFRGSGPRCPASRWCTGQSPGAANRIRFF